MVKVASASGSLNPRYGQEGTCILPGNRGDLTENHISASSALELPLNKNQPHFINVPSDLGSVPSILQLLSHLTLSGFQQSLLIPIIWMRKMKLQ